MKTADILNGQICEGDYIKEDGEYREVIGFEIYDDCAPCDSTVLFSDGGLMGISEVQAGNIYLESEVIH